MDKLFILDNILFGDGAFSSSPCNFSLRSHKKPSCTSSRDDGMQASHSAKTLAVSIWEEPSNENSSNEPLIEAGPSVLVIYAEIPGIKKEDVSISVDGDVINIRCKRNPILSPTPSSEKSETRFYLSEIHAESSFSSFLEYSRKIQVPTDRFNIDTASASVSNGTLAIKIPRKTSKGPIAPKSIPIL
ncbi:hypothetical protein MDAP_000410 [Mitosporidium daphniae]|uniref:Heat shock protein Hsp20 n=1 Tax=Mitosporidium daphniae TaxID=1485682 RepID=A0A098VTR5_9MICR|nr:heat shock protein Hsp20 [Mitosporidium daphniae]KGG52493.1 heat shock protein Hsp20 [Mitosporidium daphniae]|eukprot:XP_013238929.1 heat shock protein Hsp20 [Mitosporidium daphniae]